MFVCNYRSLIYILLMLFCFSVIALEMQYSEALFSQKESASLIVLSRKIIQVKVLHIIVTPLTWRIYTLIKSTFVYKSFSFLRAPSQMLNCSLKAISLEILLHLNCMTFFFQIFLKSVWQVWYRGQEHSRLCSTLLVLLKCALKALEEISRLRLWVPFE